MIRTVLAGLAVLAVMVVGTGCGTSDDPDAGTEPGSKAEGQKPKPTPEPKPTPTPTPKPTPTKTPLPEAANGTDLKACTDGNCEVLVETGTRIPLADRFGFTNFEVTSVEDGAVNIEPKFPNGGGSMSATPGVTVGSNGIGIQVPAVQGDQAVLLIFAQ